MQKRIFVSIISLGALLILAAMLVFSWAQVSQAQARGQQNQNGAQAPPVPAPFHITGNAAESSEPSVPAPPGWKPCPRCQNNADRKAANALNKVDGHPFDPHDFTGVWGFSGTGRLGPPPP